MDSILTIPTNSFWFSSVWAAGQSPSLGPSAQDFLDQDAALADSLATISQNKTTGFATLATQAAQKRIQAQIKALLDQAGITSSGSTTSTATTPGSSVNKL